MPDYLKGTTDQSIYLQFLDFQGRPYVFAGEPASESGLDLWYRREGEAVVSLGLLNSLFSLESDHADRGLKLVSDGLVRVDYPDAAFADGDSDEVLFGGSLDGGVIVPQVSALIDGVTVERLSPF